MSADATMTWASYRNRAADHDVTNLEFRTWDTIPVGLRRVTDGGEREVLVLTWKIPQSPVWVPHMGTDERGNLLATEGCDRCACGCKYWENDLCIDCGDHVSHAEKL